MSDELYKVCSKEFYSIKTSLILLRRFQISQVTFKNTTPTINDGRLCTFTMYRSEKNTNFFAKIANIYFSWSLVTFTIE